MLKEQVEPDVMTAGTDGENEIGMGLLEAGLDKRPRQEDQGIPIQKGSGGGGEVSLEKGSSILRDGEDGLEVGIVGMGGGVNVGHIVTIGI